MRPVSAHAAVGTALGKLCAQGLTPATKKAYREAAIAINEEVEAEKRALAKAMEASVLRMNRLAELSNALIGAMKEAKKDVS